MAFHFLPKAQGLYRPEFEHDACGIGLYAHMKGKAAHYIVQKGLQLLCQLDHRGGQGRQSASGDGAGSWCSYHTVIFPKRQNFRYLRLVRTALR